MRISVIANAAAAEAGELLRPEVERLREEGHEVQVRLTFEKGDAERFASEAAEQGAELLVAGGGDGTIHEVVNGIVAWLEDGGAAAPRLGVLPLGTGNDLAAGLELPTEPGAAFDVALAGRVQPLDVGCVNGRCFLNVSTGGFGAEATDETSPEAKRALGALAYVVTGVKKFVGLDLSSARFRAGDELLYDGPFFVFAVGNARRTGGGNWLTPRADPADGLLDVCIVGEMPRLDFVRLLPELRAGNHLEHPAVVYRQVARLEIEADRPLSVNADGEALPSGERFVYTLAPWRLPTGLPRPLAPHGANPPGG